jgi:hypothetical protein
LFTEVTSESEVLALVVERVMDCGEGWACGEVSEEGLLEAGWRVEATLKHHV